MEALGGDADREHLLIDSTIIRAHQHSAGAGEKGESGPRPLARRDEHRHTERNLVERFLNKVKNCRRVATRYEKPARSHLAFWQLASIMVLLA